MCVFVIKSKHIKTEATAQPYCHYDRGHTLRGEGEGEIQENTFMGDSLPHTSISQVYQIDL